MLDNIRIVLVNPSHPGNIGAAARAMKNMGLSELYLVQPEEFPSSHASARAAGADDVLHAAVVVHSLETALTDCHLVFGTSARSRTLKKPMVTPRECAEFIRDNAQSKCALVFGRERVGLYNEELSLCHQHIVIPTNEEFSSLNLAAAVQVVCYELRLASLSEGEQNKNTKMRQVAPQDQVLGFYSHLQDTLTEIGFLDPRQPKMLMQRLQRLFNRAALDTKEINIMRGILSKVDSFVTKKDI